jgi:uncharacterized membrane protein
MKRTKIKKIKLSLVAFVVASGFFLAAAISQTVSATSDSATSSSEVDCENKNAYGLSIRTATERLQLIPGEEFHRFVRVKNNGCEPITFRVEARPLSPGAEYRDDFQTQNQWTQISRYITFEQESYTLEIGETISVPYTVSVPENTKIAAGGQYAAIAFIGERQNVDGVAMIPEVMYKIVGWMSGEVVREYKITEQKIPFWIRDGGELTTSFKVENKGNVDSNAYGSLTVRGIFGNKVYETPEGKRTLISVFPETSTPSRNVNWENAQIGLFWVTQTVEINGDNHDKTRLVWIAPIWLTIVVLVGIAALIFLIVFNVIRAKKKKSGIGVRRTK